MSDVEQDSSASTGRFRAFVERADEDAARRRFPLSPAALIVVGAVIAAIIIAVVALA
jgi:hypothetical protein